MPGIGVDPITRSRDFSDPLSAWDCGMCQLTIRPSIVVEVDVGPGNNNFTTAEQTRVNRERTRTKQDLRCGHKRQVQSCERIVVLDRVKGLEQRSTHGNITYCGCNTGYRSQEANEQHEP